MAAGAWFGFDHARAGTLGAYLAVVAPSFAIAAFHVVEVVREGKKSPRFQKLVPRWGDLSLGFVVALAMFGSSYGIVRLVAGSGKAIWVTRIYDQAGDTGVLKDHLVLVGVGMVVAAIAEELAWRGFVRDALLSRLGSKAWLASAVFYAVAHLATVWRLADELMGKNPLLVLGTLASGLVYGAMSESTKRLAPAVVAHALFDWTVIVMFRLYGTSV